MWLFRGEGLERGRMGRAEVAHTSSPSYSQQPCLASTLPKDLGALFALWQKSPGPAPSTCEFLVESTWHREITSWKITVSGEYHIIYRLDLTGSETESHSVVARGEKVRNTQDFIN